MYRSSEPVASARARWLAELDEALHAAERVASLLGKEQSDGKNLAVLRGRILAVRSELDALRRSGLGEVRREIDPDWTKPATWRGNSVQQ